MSDAQRMPGVPEAQQDDVLKRYPLRRLRIPVGAGQLSLVVPDERVWMRRGTWAHDVARGKEPPYWLRVWPAAVAMARLLVGVRSLGDQGALHGVRVLDLGCGVGVPGVLAGGLGAEVCFVDAEAHALRFAEWNARAQPGRVAVPSAQWLDWRGGLVAGSFDMVLLSDVSYHVSHHEPVRRQLREVLAEGGCVLHSDPGRELSTQFLSSLEPDYVQISWQRDTAFLAREAKVRLTLLARTADDLMRWRERLGIRVDGAGEVAVAGASRPPTETPT